MGHMMTLYLTVWGYAKLFFKVAGPFLFPLSVYEGFIFSVSLLTFVIVCLFDCSQPSGYKVMSYYGFGLHFPIDQ